MRSYSLPATIPSIMVTGCDLGDRFSHFYGMHQLALALLEELGYKKDEGSRVLRLAIGQAVPREQ